MLARQRRSPALATRRSPWATLSSCALSSLEAREGPSFRRGRRGSETPADRKQRQRMKNFELLPHALDDFKNSAGHYVVPYHFSIPLLGGDTKHSRASRVYGLVGHADEIQWRDEVRGLSLGRALATFLENSTYQQRLPHVIDQLEERGFRRGETLLQYTWREQTMQALRVFYEIHGHSIVPQLYETPRDDARWPNVAKGLRLGFAVHYIRIKSEELTNQQLRDLASVEFVAKAYEATWSQKVLPSLEVFASVHGHCRVPYDFVVPASEPYPERAGGLRLGETVNNIRSNGHFEEQTTRDAARLEAIEFVWNDSEYQWTRIVLPSLEAHFREQGHSLVTRSFVVPSRAPYPQGAWGVNLGYNVHRMRSQTAFAKYSTRDADRLEAIDFSWNSRQTRWDQVILPALEAYFRIHGNIRVPSKFVVPSEAPWPKKTWGCKLGFAYESMLYRGAYAAQQLQDHARLAAIGFPIKTD